MVAKSTARRVAVFLLVSTAAWAQKADPAKRRARAPAARVVAVSDAHGSPQGFRAVAADGHERLNAIRTSDARGAPNGFALTSSDGRVWGNVVAVAAHRGEPWGYRVYLEGREGLRIAPMHDFRGRVKLVGYEVLAGTERIGWIPGTMGIPGGGTLLSYDANHADRIMKRALPIIAEALGF